ncbi:MAG: hypothetical protein IPN29_20435 [Saprospiraceae bacterium]|nr:hypothetical protein [Saprospiraceae bacterium]
MAFVAIDSATTASNNYLIKLMMRKLKFILIIFLLKIGQATFACDCSFQGEFLKVAPKTEFVALVKVTKYLKFKDIYNQQTPMSMEVDIIDVYKGTETRNTITIWGDNGILCRPYLSQFDIGQYYVIAFYKGSDGSKGRVHQDEKTTDYSISNCGEYWLKADINKQVARGSVTDKQTQIKLKDLKAKL